MEAKMHTQTKETEDGKVPVEGIKMESIKTEGIEMDGIKNVEIERKYTVLDLPRDLPSRKRVRIEQAYLNVDPVIRIRRENSNYFLTYKGEGLLARDEYTLPLNKESYEHLRKKADGNLVTKTRYLIPLMGPSFREGTGFVSGDPSLTLTIELDVFDPPFYPLVIAEVEFPSREMAKAFVPPDWFHFDVTYNPEYHNSYLSRCPVDSLISSSAGNRICS